MIRLLLVDDERGLREVLAMHLKRRQIEVDVAEGMREGLARFEKGSYDIVLTDDRMPDGNGLELLKRCRAIRQTPFILMTGTPDFDQVKAKALGVYGVALKPFGMEALFKLIAAATSDQAGGSPGESSPGPARAA